MINSFKGNKKKNIFWNKVYFQIVPVIIVSFLGLAVGVRESCTVCQQAFSTLAKDSASHLVQMDPTWLCLFTVGSYSDVCGGKKTHNFLYLPTPRLCGEVAMCVFSFAFFSFQKIFVVSRLSRKPYLKPWGSSEENPEHNSHNEWFITFRGAGQGTWLEACV